MSKNAFWLKPMQTPEHVPNEIGQMLFEGAGDALDAFRRLLPAVADNRFAAAVVNAHIELLEGAMDAALRGKP